MDSGQFAMTSKQLTSQSSGESGVYSGGSYASISPVCSVPPGTSASERVVGNVEEEKAEVDQTKRGKATLNSAADESDCDIDENLDAIPNVLSKVPEKDDLMVKVTEELQDIRLQMKDLSEQFHRQNKEKERCEAEHERRHAEDKTAQRKLEDQVRSQGEIIATLRTEIEEYKAAIAANSKEQEDKMATTLGEVKMMLNEYNQENWKRYLDNERKFAEFDEQRRKNEQWYKENAERHAVNERVQDEARQKLEDKVRFQGEIIAKLRTEIEEYKAAIAASSKDLKDKMANTLGEIKMMLDKYNQEAKDSFLGLRLTNNQRDAAQTQHRAILNRHTDQITDVYVRIGSLQQVLVTRLDQKTDQVAYKICTLQDTCVQNFRELAEQGLLTQTVSVPPEEPPDEDMNVNAQAVEENG